MGFRLQKRKKIAPGITAGVSKSGLSVRVGGRNAGVSVGKRGVRASASAPGTGLPLRDVPPPPPGASHQTLFRHCVTSSWACLRPQRDGAP